MNWILLIFTTCALFGVPGMSLKCYQCTSASLDPCPEEDLKNCSSSQAYDSCSIRIKKEEPNGNLVVTRHCILGPCDLRDSKAGKVINFGNNCDLDSGSVDCVACCKSDGCNKNYQISIVPSSLIVFQFSVFTILAYIWSN